MPKPKDTYPRLREEGRVYIHHVHYRKRTLANKAKISLMKKGYKVRIKQIYGIWVVYRYPFNKG